MKKKIIWNDIKGNRLLAISTWMFMAFSTLLIALTCFLFINLLSSIDVLMARARTPDYMQMHTGEIDAQEIQRFAEENESVRDYQIMRLWKTK